MEDDIEGGGAKHHNITENINKYCNTAKKFRKYRNTASKVDEIPKSQKLGILFTLCPPADKNCEVKDFFFKSLMKSSLTRENSNNILLP